MAVATRASPIRWTRSDALTEGSTTSTLIPWLGRGKVTGAFLLTRLNLDFINDTCNRYINTLEKATQVSMVLEKTELRGTSSHQQRRYGFTLLRVESELMDTLEYLHKLVLCSGRGGVLWSKFVEFRDQATKVWYWLRKLGVNKYDSEFPAEFPNREPPTMVVQRGPDRNVTGESLIETMYNARPNLDLVKRQPRGLFLLGVGLGLVGSLIAERIFGGNINTLNRDLGKSNKMVKVTNERIDILTKNISSSNEIIKSILDKMVEQNKNTDLHYAIQWNLDQLVALNTEIQNTFRLSELTLTLLDQGILNPDLIELDSLNTIITEGLKLFPSLSFPLPISRFQLHHIVKLLKVQRVGRVQFLLIIPLTQPQDYEIFTMVPHPIKISDTTLAVPKVEEIILKTEDTYLTTGKHNIQSISTTKHVLLEVEPIFRQSFTTCAWAVFMKQTADIIKHCDFDKAGQVNDTFVVETDSHRLVYFTASTEVNLDCPGKKISTTLNGLHNMSLACDISTNKVHWPSKQTARIDIRPDDEDTFKIVELPIAQINKSSEVHDSLKELINKLPRKNQPYTFDFDYYNLSTEQLHTYTIVFQTVIAIMVIINSILLGIVCWKWKKIQHTNNSTEQGSTSFSRNLGKINDSFRTIKNKLGGDNIEAWRRSLRNRSSALKGKVKTSMSTHQDEKDPVSSEENKQEHYMEDDKVEYPIYPPLPRYHR